MSILINRGSRIVILGWEAGEAVALAGEARDGVTRVVGVVCEGRGRGMMDGIPVLASLSQACRKQVPHAAVITVPPSLVKRTAAEAIRRNVPLLVISTPRVPLHDMMEVFSYARERALTIIGPNSLGILSPGKGKAGMLGGSHEECAKIFRPGPAGLLSRSGGLLTEIAYGLTRLGIGQSTCIGMGGDPLVGVHLVEIYRLFERDPQTKFVVISTGPGERGEEELGAYYQESGRRKLLLALVVGQEADRVPGLDLLGERGNSVRETVQKKKDIFTRAGIEVFGDLGALTRRCRELAPSCAPEGTPPRIEVLT